MDKLVFHNDTHTYVVDGHILPSVSDIFSPLEDFSKVNPEVLRRKAKIGSLVHEYTELLDYGEEIHGFEVEEEVRGYVLSYSRFLHDYSPEWTAIEKPLYSEEFNFAGTLDRLGIIDGRKTLVDIKTASSVTPRTKISWAAKLQAYSVLLGEEVQRWNLLLMPDGKYRIYNAETTESTYNTNSKELFELLLRINKIMEV